MNSGAPASDERERLAGSSLSLEVKASDSRSPIPHSQTGSSQSAASRPASSVLAQRLRRARTIVPSKSRLRWRNVTFRPDIPQSPPPVLHRYPRALGKQRVHMLIILGPQLNTVR
jgi:hypothetical protein